MRNFLASLEFLIPRTMWVPFSVFWAEQYKFSMVLWIISLEKVPWKNCCCKMFWKNCLKKFLLHKKDACKMIQNDRGKCGQPRRMLCEVTLKLKGQARSGEFSFVHYFSVAIGLLQGDPKLTTPKISIYCMTGLVLGFCRILL